MGRRDPQGGRQGRLIRLLAAALLSGASFSTQAQPAAEPARAMDPMPRPGDEWHYRLTEPRRTAGTKDRSYVAKVVSAKDLAITEQFSIDGGPSGEWTHKGERQVVALGLSLFSPYMLAYGPPSAFPRQVPVVEPACSGNYLCEASARLVRYETVRVPAGTFDCIKVEVEHSWRPAVMSGQFGAQLAGARILTIWYAFATKRAVKFSSRVSFGAHAPIETDFDLELVSYKLN